MQEIILTQKYIDSKLIKTRVLIARNMQDCAFKTLEWSFFIPNCEQYSPGSFLEVIGTPIEVSDKGLFHLKRLKVQAVKQFYQGRLSVKHWWRRAVIFINQKTELLLEKGLVYLPMTHARLVGGMIFGGTAELPQEIKDNFQVTGLTHVVSASGYNVSIMAGLGLVIFSRIFSKKTTTWLMILTIWIYAVAANLVPPIIRASLMTTINLIASRVFFRQSQVLFSLFLTVILMLGWEPFYALSLSFWLSTLSTLGIILVLPLLESQKGLFSWLSTGDFSSKKAAVSTNVFKESLGVTLAAQSLTLPLVGMVFKEVSILSFLANTVLLWLTPVITLAGLGLVVCRVFLVLIPGLWELIGPVLSLGVWFPAQVFLSGVAWFGQFKWGVALWSLPNWASWLWWVMLGVIILRKKYVSYSSY